VTDATVPAPLPETPAEAPVSAGGAIVGTFTEPGRTFSRLAKRPTWWLPLVISIVAAILSVVVATPKMDMEKSVRQQMEKQAEKRGGTVNDAQVEQALAVSKKFSALAPVFVVVVGTAAFFVIGLILWGFAQAMGGETKYGQVLAVWGHGQLPNVISGLLAIPVFLARPDASLTQEEASTVFKSSVGAFLPLETHAALRAFASSIDVFTFATLALLVIGFRRLPGLKAGTGAAVPIGAFVLWVVVKTLWMAVFG
jgi:hypothetical protein